MNVAIERTKGFVKERFQKFPHYSFDHWSVMYNHSVNVEELALEIAKGKESDTTVVAISALLHDIGKTVEVDAETLHKKHEEFNLPVSEKFLDSLDVSPEQRNRIKDVISNKDLTSAESLIIEDADALALYKDKELYMKYIMWAKDMDPEYTVKRKIGKFDKLHFEESRQMGQPWLETMKKDWGEFLGDKRGEYGL